jgi:hypothetical protein
MFVGGGGGAPRRARRRPAPRARAITPSSPVGPALLLHVMP